MKVPGCLTRFLQIGIGFILIVTAIGYYLFHEAIFGTELVNGYYLKQGGEHESYLIKDDARVVDSNVVFHAVHESYLILLRLPVYGMSCDNGNVNKLKYENRPEYYLLDTSQNGLEKFLRRDDFQHRLAELGLSDSIKIGYGRLYDAWQNRLRSSDHYNFSGCLQVRF